MDVFWGGAVYHDWDVIKPETYSHEISIMLEVTMFDVENHWRQDWYTEFTKVWEPDLLRDFITRGL